MDKKAQVNFWFIVVAVLSLLLVQNLYTQYTQVEPIPYSRFQHLLEQGRVAEIAITENQIFGTLKEKHADGFKDFVTTRVEPDLAEVLDKQPCGLYRCGAKHLVARFTFLDCANGHFYRYLVVYHPPHGQ